VSATRSREKIEKVPGPIRSFMTEVTAYSRHIAALF